MALSKNSKILASDVTGAIKSITRSGTTFTYTTLGGSTGTFTQQDNNTTYSAGTGISISSNKISNTGVTSVNGQTGAVTVSATSYPQVAVAHGNRTTVNCTRSGNNVILPSGGTWYYITASEDKNGSAGSISGGGSIRTYSEDSDDGVFYWSMVAIRVA